MQKKYIVRLSETEREVCKDVVRKLKGPSSKVRRAQIFLKTDADGPCWTDELIADAFDCRRQTVERLRQRCVTHLSSIKDCPLTHRQLFGPEGPVLGAVCKCG